MQWINKVEPPEPESMSSNTNYNWNGEDWSQTTDQISAEMIWRGNERVCSKINKLIPQIQHGLLLSQKQEILNIMRISIKLSQTIKQANPAEFCIIGSTMSCAYIASSVQYIKINIKGLQ
jgi:hypothetical protein